MSPPEQSSRQTEKLLFPNREVLPLSFHRHHQLGRVVCHLGSCHQSTFMLSVPFSSDLPARGLSTPPRQCAHQTDQHCTCKSGMENLGQGFLSPPSSPDGALEENRVLGNHCDSRAKVRKSYLAYVYLKSSVQSI